MRAALAYGMGIVSCSALHGFGVIPHERLVAEVWVKVLGDARLQRCEVNIDNESITVRVDPGELDREQFRQCWPFKPVRSVAVGAKGSPSCGSGLSGWYKLAGSASAVFDSSSRLACPIDGENRLQWPVCAQPCAPALQSQCRLEYPRDRLPWRKCSGPASRLGLPSQSCTCPRSGSRFGSGRMPLGSGPSCLRSTDHQATSNLR